MKCEILRTTRTGQQVVATISLEDGHLSYSGNPNLVDCLRTEDQVFILPDGRRLDAKKNPEVWMRAPPYRFNGSYLRARLTEPEILIYGVIPSGAGGDTLVFIPFQRARQLAAIHRAIATAKTWRDFLHLISHADREDLIQHFQTGISDADMTPDPGSTFDSSFLPGFMDGDYPDWPEQRMMEWLPAQVVEDYGSIHGSAINGPFLSFDPNREADIVDALTHAGFTCRRDDARVTVACGRVFA